MERRALLGLAVTATAATLSVARPASASSEGGAAPVATYQRLPIVTASILRADGLRGVLSIETGLDTPDAALRARVLQSVPRLRAAYATAAQTFANGLRPGMPPDVDRLAALLQAATNTALGRPGARFLLGAVLAV
ncbi:Tat pathway signal protein [Brevundimonas sp. SORGH_AS_0993]|uniref:Tat pathway signal protein n=1 Tax=Brevundimonas sp. SORGH_AS_0993 TaxID=3041794 RepID=UPI0027832732|nr:Tat pathway signal protein [Brevundimonas sp. SORGH_AS_0993]MDQ1154848.1 hypothetical protein [Brevundimonas sp. SORGH_AS_0993]